MKNNKIIVILGVHRSGTSLLTRSLRCFNFNYGEKLHPSGTDNPKGFFEDVDIIELNEKILAEINFSWDSPQLLDDAKLEIIRKKFSTKAKKLILEKINKGITCFKDPRITKLIDFWVEIFESLKQDFFYILAILFTLPLTLRILKIGLSEQVENAVNITGSSRITNKNNNIRPLSYLVSATIDSMLVLFNINLLSISL